MIAAPPSETPPGEQEQDVARCSYHPDVETDLTCTECGKPICPKEMVLTPVGYKCPEHARPDKGQLRYVKPKQLIRALVVAVIVGIVSGVVLGFVNFFPFLIGILWGSLTAEAVRRASGGHRGGTIAVTAVVSIAIAMGVSWAVGNQASWFAAIIAVVVALAQLAVIEFRR